MELAPIGIVKSCYPDKFGTPRQPGLVPESRAFLEISSTYQPQDSLQGLQEFSHLWVLFHFHKNNTARFHAKVHPPRLGGASLGVFATRSPHRPNPVGLSVVKIEGLVLEGPSLGIWVSGIDLVDGTPILDIKPYLPEADCLPLATSGWTQRVPRTEIIFEWSQPALAVLETAGERKSLIESTLRLDPRPVVYRGFEGQSEDQSKYRNTHAVRIMDWDIHFRFATESLIEIEKIDRSSLPKRSENGITTANP